METKDYGNGMGRDITMCGDPMKWYPMRVTYGREMKVKGELDRLGLENFVPMTFKMVESLKDGNTELQKTLVPAITNLIFVRSTQERISGLKMTNEILEPLRYISAIAVIRRNGIGDIQGLESALGIPYVYI